MLRCPKCSTDNLLSAVFCRGCGERLNLDEIKPDNFNEMGDTKADPNARKNLIGGIILGAIVVILAVGFFCPGCGKLSTDEEAQKKAGVRYGTVMLKGTTDTFTNQDATDLMNGLLNNYYSKNGTENPAIKDITVQFHEGNRVKAIISRKFLGLPATITAWGDISVSGGSISVAVTSIKIGLLPVISALEPQLLDDLRQDLNGATSTFNRRLK
ncbi:MAG: zinc ribbon domain-containing protein, partial [Victivallales bacterium]|nr:zinc ribbon domain-containing protein [Victivallales bacterium]